MPPKNEHGLTSFERTVGLALASILGGLHFVPSSDVKEVSDSVKTLYAEVHSANTKLDSVGNSISVLNTKQDQTALTLADHENRLRDLQYGQRAAAEAAEAASVKP